jgi:hypothetical protein
MSRLRAAMFEHLDRLLQTSPDGALPSPAINTFTSRGGKQVDRSKMFRRLAAPATDGRGLPRRVLAPESSKMVNVPSAANTGVNLAPRMLAK